MSTDAKSYVIPPPPQPVIAVAGTDKFFPVRRLWCVGRNYVEHIKEMGQDVREPPFFFAKPADAIVADGATVPYPPLTKDMHHEVELVVALERRAQHQGRAGARLHSGMASASISPDATCRSPRATSSGRGRSARPSTIRRRAGRSSLRPRSGTRRRAASCSRSTARCARTATSIR